MNPSTAHTQDLQPIARGHTGGRLPIPDPRQMILDAAARFEGVALQYRRDGQTVRISYPALGAISTEIAQGLISLGIAAGDRVAILG